MQEHIIRLRGGWTCEPDDAVGPARSAGRLTLPLDSPGAIVAPARLRREFQSPPVDAGREAVWLRLAGIVGVGRITLNEAILTLAGPVGPDEVIEVDLTDRLAPRNRLELEVEPARMADASPGPWGEVALLIRAVAPNEPKLPADADGPIGEPGG